MGGGVGLPQRRSDPGCSSQGAVAYHIGETSAKQALDEATLAQMCTAKAAVQLLLVERGNSPKQSP